MLPPRSLIAFLPLVALAASSATAQEYGILLGLGQTAWTSTAAGAWDPRADLTLGALTGEWGLGGSLAARVELGGGARRAGLGRTGFFGEETHVSSHRVQLGVVLRPSVALGDGRVRWFAEAGANGWVQTLCDVDLSGGPGPFGGETVSCEDWVTEDDVGPLVPRGSGIAWTLGTGVRLDRWAFGLRYEREAAATLGTSSGEARPQVFQLTGQWLFRQGPSPGPDTIPGEEGRPGEGSEGAPAQGHRSGGLGNALVAGALEAVFPSFGYLYADRWGEGFLPNLVRLSGPVVMIVGWGMDSEGLLFTGVGLLTVGTVWAVVGAARRGGRRGAPMPSGRELLLGVTPSGASSVGVRWVR